MTKKEFLKQLRKLKDPVIDECSNCGTLDYNAFSFHIHERNNEWGEGYFFTNNIQYSKWNPKETWEEYQHRIDKFKTKIYRWFEELNLKEF